MDTALTWFIRIWIVIALAVNVAGARLAMSDSAWKALEIFSPFSLTNLVAEIILFSPAFLALSWREKRRAKAGAASAAPAARFQGDPRSAPRDDKAGLRGSTRPVDLDEKAGLRRDTQPASRDDKTESRRDTQPAKRDDKTEPRRDTQPAKRANIAGLRGDIRSATRELDEQLERMFENFPPKRPV
jgi:hypothetical protein